MKWIRTCSAAIAMLSLTTIAHAGLFGSHGSGKSCGCASSCQPKCCAPTVKRPCCPTVHTYQRKVSTIKPPCCNTCRAPQSCCPKRCGCAKPCGCSKPCSCSKRCGTKKPCCTPQPAKCAKPPVKCATPAPTKCGAKKNCCQKKSCCQQKCCNADPCVIAKLIYTSQTACYARDRRHAIDDLGDFDLSVQPRDHGRHDLRPERCRRGRSQGSRR